MSSLSKIMVRLQALDAALLVEGGVSVKGFATKWSIEERTVRRYIQLFRELGQEIVKHTDKTGRATQWLKYGEYQDPLFVVSHTLENEFFKVTTKTD